MEKRAVQKNVQARLLKLNNPLYQIAINNYDAVQIIKNNRNVPVRQYIKNLSVHQDNIRIGNTGDIDYMKKVVKLSQEDTTKHLDYAYKKAQLTTAEFMFEAGNLQKTVQMVAEMVPSSRYFAIKVTTDESGKPVLHITPTVQMIAREKQESSGYKSYQYTGQPMNYGSSDYSDDSENRDSESESINNEQNNKKKNRRRLRDLSSTEEEVTENDVSDENDAEERGMSRRDKKLAKQRLRYAREVDREEQRFLDD